MNHCICRNAYHFDEIPDDVCCLLFSKMARILVKNGTAYEITKEEALKRVDRAAELGLIGQAMWIEVEQFIWGLQNEEMDGFFEICFCHPTCCVAMNVVRYGNRKIKSRFNPSGWTAVADIDKCIGCGKCKENCVQAAIEIVNGKVQINQEYCYGCGVCRANCPESAIKIKQTMPMRGDIEEYFEKEGRIKVNMDGSIR
jgi:ferredoxin